MALVFLGLGTNLGNKNENLELSCLLIEKEIGTITIKSGIYKSGSWGYHSENEFMNMVICIETALNATDILHKTQDIEKKLGRTTKTTQQYTDRIIDIDILLYDNDIISSDELSIPHPLMTKRDFVMIPLYEISPELVHPVLGKKIKEIYSSSVISKSCE